MESEDASVIGNVPPKYEAAQQSSKRRIALALLEILHRLNLPLAVFLMRSIGLLYRHYACYFKW